MHRVCPGISTLLRHLTTLYPQHGTHAWGPSVSSDSARSSHGSEGGAEGGIGSSGDIPGGMPGGIAGGIPGGPAADEEVAEEGGPARVLRLDRAVPSLKRRWRCVGGLPSAEWLVEGAGDWWTRRRRPPAGHKHTRLHCVCIQVVAGCAGWCPSLCVCVAG